ncbi:histidine phosphatase family protein [Fredinandcohnia humi]
MELILIRHLPTPWNTKGILQGRRDIPIQDLSESDKEDILRNKKQLKERETFSHVLVSSLKRTHQTAEAYGYTNFKVEPLLDELDFGDFEGKAKRELIETYKKEWFHTPSKVVLGEKLTDLENRMLAFINKYKNVDSVLAFGHGSWMRTCLSYERYGTIDRMNDIDIRNNQLLIIDVTQFSFGEEEYNFGRHHL